jgi:hypothetical protein
VPKVKKIWGLNLPGTPWATSACCGKPLSLPYTSNMQLQQVQDCVCTICMFLVQLMLWTSRMVNYSSLHLISAFVPQLSSNKIMFVTITIQRSHIQQNHDFTFLHFVFSAPLCTCGMLPAKCPEEKCFPDFTFS